MKKRVKRTKVRGVSKSVYWIPRIVSIVFLLFLTLFSFDVISPGLGFWQIVLGMLMHNIPVFILAIVLWISWKYEIVGGIAFIIAGIAYLISVAMRQPWYIVLSWSMIIAGPAFVIGILFLMNWFGKKKR